MRTEAAIDQRDTGKLPNLVAVGLTFLTSLLLIVLPISTRQTQTTSPDGTPKVTTTRVPFSYQEGQEGIGVLPILFAPIAISAVPLATHGTRRQRKWRIGCAAIFTVGCLLAGLSIGLFYFPAMGAMWWAARRTA